MSTLIFQRFPSVPWSGFFFWAIFPRSLGVKISKNGYNSKNVYFFTKHDRVAYQINQYEETNPTGVVIFFYKVNFSLRMRSKVDLIKIWRFDQSHAYTSCDHGKKQENDNPSNAVTKKMLGKVFGVVRYIVRNHISIPGISCPWRRQGLESSTMGFVQVVMWHP